MEGKLIRVDGVEGPASGREAGREAPPILAGSHTATVAHKVESFSNAVAEMFERWVARCESRHTRRAYRRTS